MAPDSDYPDYATIASLKMTLDLNGEERVRERHIYAPDEFDFGRSDVKKHFDHVDMRISEHHFRIRCVVFDEEDATLPPMAYMQVLSANGVQMCSHHEKKHIKPTDGARLLNTGDSFKISKHVTVEYIDERLGSDVAVQHRTTLTCSKEAYTLTKQTIGSGAFAKVVIAYQGSTREQLACKILPLRRSTPGVEQEWRNLLWRELEILRSIDHPNIVSVRKALWTASNLYIIQDLVTGGDLLSYQQMNGKLCEPEVLSIAYQLVTAVHYLHERSIVHRDIKPENILLSSWRRGTRIVLADFGQARSLSALVGSTGGSSTIVRMSSIAGTVGWQAPELRTTSYEPVSELSYSMAVDMWSVGSVVHAALTNRKPDDWISANESDLIAFPAFVEWFAGYGDEASPRAVQFMQGCLQIDDSLRMTAAQAVNHDWITCPLYRNALVNQCQRAIQGWTPRQLDGDMIEDCSAQDSYPAGLTSATTDDSILSAIGNVAQEHNVSTDDYLPPRSTQLSQPAAARIPMAVLEEWARRC